MLDHDLKSDTAPEDALRDEDGEIRADYLERVRDAVEHHDSAVLRILVGELHEADAGDLIEALDPDLRPQLIELMGKDFDFSALTEVDDTVREEILDELKPETVAEGVRELDSDDAVYILEDLDRKEQDEILQQLPHGRAGRARTQPDLSGRIRRPADADRVHRGAAVLECRAGHRLYARDRRSAGTLLRALCGRRRPETARRGRARPAVAHQASGPGHRT